MINEVRPSETTTFEVAAIMDMLGRDGYVVARGALTAEEILELRRVVKSHLNEAGVRLRLGKTQPDAAARVPALAWVFAHPAVVKLFQGLCGENSTVFTRHCDAHMNMVSGWHKDSGESVAGGYFRGDYFGSPDCRVFKAALYLHDSTPKSGLKVVPGSHRDRSVNSTGAVHLPTQAGDVIIFDVRLTHAGQLPDNAERALMALSRVARPWRGPHDPRWAYGLRQVYWRLTGKADRLSIFFTFGTANEFTFDFADANIRRQSGQLDPTDAAREASVGVAVGDLARTLARAGVLTYGVNVGV